MPRNASLEQANRCLLLTLALEQAVLHGELHETQALFQEREMNIQSLAGLQVSPEALEVLRNAQAVESRVCQLMIRLQAEISDELRNSHMAERLARSQWNTAGAPESFESTA